MNAFYNSNGFSKHIPTLYSSLNLRSLNSFNKGLFFLREFYKERHSFHSKGIWVFFKQQNPDLTAGKQPYCDNFDLLTVIGSSNYNERSIKRDLEMSFALFVPKTANKLQKSLLAVNLY